MRTAVLIVAAGRGVRAGGGLPKQWRPLAGRRVADWTLDAVRAAGLDRIAVVLHPDDRAIPLPPDVLRVTGGASRSDSVRAGLEALAEDPPDVVLIHDIARPCVTPALFARVRDELATSQAAAPGDPVTDALWLAQDGHVTGIADRTGLVRAQTPQGFHFGPLLAAHRAHQEPAADDVAVAHAAGIAVRIVAGEPENLKITGPEDFDRATRILAARAGDATHHVPARGGADIRIGNGFDVHRFGPGDSVVLCGIRLPHPRGLDGHSDADVAMHAITDALYGALAEGDIGRHFPPSDPQWKGAASEIFLAHAGDLVRSRGYAIGNIDCTIICESPKIGPHAVDMQSEISRILGAGPDRVSVKATTSERLGFTGREEGIAALANATLVRA